MNKIHLSLKKEKNKAKYIIDSFKKENYDYIELCHRLDKNTSGCMIIAKNKKFLLEFQIKMRILTN